MNLIGQEMPNVVLRCTCGNPDHMLVIDYDQEDDTYLVYSQMDHYLPWYKRLWVSWWYIRGKKSPRYHFTESIVSGNHFRASVKSLEKYSQQSK